MGGSQVASADSALGGWRQSLLESLRRLGSGIATLFTPPARPAKVESGGLGKVLAAPVTDLHMDVLQQSEIVTTTINYSYDPLYRLTEADYSDDTFFHYAYDAVGNRLVMTDTLGTRAYAYDDANQLSLVNVVTYTWDANGNLLSDGETTYAYDSANRLVSLTQGVDSYAYDYNGLGDRVSQTANSQTTHYTLDLAAPLTQVLADGKNTYLYGLSRIVQQSGSGRQYFLGDALGSVRQLSDPSAAPALPAATSPMA